MKIGERLTWAILACSLAVVGIECLGVVMGAHLEDYVWFRSLLLGLPVFLLVVHSIVTLSLPRALFFTTLSLCVGFIAEAWGLKSGTLFGGRYVYHFGQLALEDVPLEVIFYWAVFVYAGYSIVSSFLYEIHTQKPHRASRGAWLLPLAVFFDGWVVVAIDLFMDPLQVKMGHWAWVDGGPYFGVPLGNFVGWFVVTIIVTGIFRTIEYFFPGKKPTFNKSLFLVPIYGYIILMLSFIFLAIRSDMPTLALVGTLFMLPIIFMNLYLASVRKR